MIRGDTFVLKENIKALGGKWNKSEVAWMFPELQKNYILKELSKLTEVKALGVNAEDGDKADAPPKKRAKTEQSGAADGLDDGILLDENGFNRASVYSYDRDTFVGVRIYYKNELACTKKLAECVDKLKDLLDKNQNVGIA